MESRICARGTIDRHLDRGIISFTGALAGCLREGLSGGETYRPMSLYARTIKIQVVLDPMRTVGRI